MRRQSGFSMIATTILVWSGYHTKKTSTWATFFPPFFLTAFTQVM